MSQDCIQNEFLKERKFRFLISILTKDRKFKKLKLNSFIEILLASIFSFAHWIVIIDWGWCTSAKAELAWAHIPITPALVCKVATAVSMRLQIRTRFHSLFQQKLAN